MKFRVWREDMDPDDDGDGGHVEALDVRDAAERRAAQDHTHRGGWEWSWPIVYVVEDDQGAVWTVEVERRAVPEFEAQRPQIRTTKTTPGDRDG